MYMYIYVCMCVKTTTKIHPPFSKSQVSILNEVLTLKKQDRDPSKQKESRFFLPAGRIGDDLKAFFNLCDDDGDERCEIPISEFLLRSSCCLLCCCVVALLRGVLRVGGWKAGWTEGWKNV